MYTYNLSMPSINYSYLYHIYKQKSIAELRNLDKIRSQWLRGLRRRSAAPNMLRLRVRIPPEAWMSVVSVVCCQVEFSATN